MTEIASAFGRNDPHLEYGVDVHPVGHDAGTLARPGAIAMSSCVVGGHVVACHAYPRYRGAEEAAADRLRLRLDLTPEARARVAEVIAVGGDPVELTPADIVGYQLPTVGHQAPADAEFSARLTPLVDTTPAALRLVLTTTEGERTVVRLTRRSFTRGNEGATSVWVSPHQCFEMTIVVRERQRRLHLSIRRITNFDGPITDVAGDINPLMRALQPRTTVALALDHGPVETAAVTVTLTDSLVDPPVVAMLDALRVIQDHTTTIVTIPDEITGKSLIDLVETAALLDGLATTGDMRSETISVSLLKTDLGPERPAGSLRRPLHARGLVFGRNPDRPSPPEHPAPQGVAVRPSVPYRPCRHNRRHRRRARHRHPRTRVDPDLDRPADRPARGLHRRPSSRAVPTRSAHQRR